MRVLKVRHHSARGSAVVLVKVGAKGVLKLSGAAVRADSVKAPRAGDYRLKVAPKGGARRRLRRRGGAKVGVRIAFRAHGGTRRVTRAIRLTRRRVHRSTHHDRHPHRPTADGGRNRAATPGFATATHGALFARSCPVPCLRFARRGARSLGSRKTHEKRSSR